ncbi:uncharacterized protein LOC122401549 [Colletes gigas]|uniref:uncharacterized protein LOC122401549 n=1 Tax=Colletes gigas TaxID=935657 RepID=UPI001C9BA64D|nr:uncharacterized protein LOC122401549 [Colletes gigas]
MTLLNKDHVITIDLEASCTSCLNSSHDRRDQAGFNRENCSNSTEGKHDQARRRLTYFTDNSVVLDQMMMINRKTRNASTVGDKTDVSVNASKRRVENTVESHKEIFWRSSPVMKLGNSVERVNEDKVTSTRTETEGVEKMVDKIMIKHSTRGYQHADVKCKNMDCNYIKNVRNMNTELTKPECMKILKEIKERTKTLEEQLILINKNITVKTRRSEKFSISEHNIDCTSSIKYIYNIKQHRDIITQQPEKEDVSIQEPSQNDITCVKCVQNTTIISGNNLDSQKSKKQNVIPQETDKKTSYTEYIVGGNKMKDKNDKDGRYKFNTKTINDIDKQINHKLLRFCNVTNSKKIQNLQDRHAWSASSFILNHSNFRPLTSFTPEKTNLSSNKKCLSHSSSSRQTNASSDKALGTKQVKEREERPINFTNLNNKQESSHCREKAIIMTLSTRAVNNTYLKSMYKKMEFMHFKPRRVVDSCVVRDRRSIKSTLPKRRVQIPAVFRQMKSVQCKVEEFVDSVKNSRDDFTDQTIEDRKVSNLMPTVSTQTSNLYINTATSVSRVTFNDKKYTREKIAQTGTCVLS